MALDVSRELRLSDSSHTILIIKPLSAQLDTPRTGKTQLWMDQIMKLSGKKVLSWLMHPAANGIYMTVILVQLTFHYYEIAGQPRAGHYRRAVHGPSKIHRLSLARARAATSE